MKFLFVKKIILLFFCIIVLFSMNFNIDGKSINSNLIPKPSSSSITYSINKQWNYTWGKIYNQNAYDIVCNGNDLYITGALYSDSGYPDYGFIVKYNSNGIEQWNKTIGTESRYYASGIALNSQGTAVYVTGWNKTSSETRTDVFLAKYNIAGDLIWIKSWGLSYDDERGSKVAVSGDESIYVVGYGNTEDLITQTDAILLKYDSMGNFIWNTSYASEFDDSGLDVCVDTSGYVYITGRSECQGKDLFAAKFNSNKNQIWNFTWSRPDASETDEGSRIRASGNSIYIVGRSNYAGFGDIVLIKLTNDGTLGWQKIWSGTAGNEYPYGLAVNGTNIFISGMTDGFEAVGVEMIVIGYDINGNEIWNSSWGGHLSDYGTSIFIFNDGNIYITGYTNSFGVGGEDAFILKYIINSTSSKDKIPGFDLPILMIAIVIGTFFLKKKVKNNINC